MVDSALGLPFVAGDVIRIASLTPGQATLLAGAGGTLYSDANGVIGWAIDQFTPGFYVSTTTWLETLIGTFAHNGVIVGSPFAIGNGPITETIPQGANELLMGVVDGWYNDNGGEVGVSVTEGVPETFPTVLLLGVGVCGLALVRKMRGLEAGLTFHWGNLIKQNSTRSLTKT